MPKLPDHPTPEHQTEVLRRRAAMKEGARQSRAQEHYLKEVLSNAYPHIPWQYFSGRAHATIEGCVPDGTPKRKAPYLVINVFQGYPEKHLWVCSIVILGLTTSEIRHPDLLTAIQCSLEDAKAILLNLLEVVPHATPLR